LEEWLRILRLEEYGPGLAQQGYRTVEQAAQLAWEDLEDTGIVKLGHQKKILLAIKRVKDIQAGKRVPCQPFPQVSISKHSKHGERGLSDHHIQRKARS
jgi:hypothetical protein